MENKKTIDSNLPKISTYLFGFLASLALTITSFGIVYLHIENAHKIFTHEAIIFALISFAIIQLLIQLIFFLHLGKIHEHKWNLVFLISTTSIILIVVIASIWIMNNLNYNMTPLEMSSYLIEKEGIHK